MLMTNEVSRACHEFYDVVGCTMQDLISHELDADFTEDDEVDTVWIFLMVRTLIGMA